jgi:hypothetical protein
MRPSRVFTAVLCCAGLPWPQCMPRPDSDRIRHWGPCLVLAILLAAEAVTWLRGQESR